jgi:hypothetical protein
VEWGFQRAKAKTISKKSGFAYDFHQEGDFRGKWGKMRKIGVVVPKFGTSKITIFTYF